jgi:hypothetical protein
MTRLLAPALVMALLGQAGPKSAQAPNVVTRESTVTATVDRIERSSRVVTLRAEGNTLQSVYVDPKVATFGDLKVGDVVVVRYIESVIVQVRPNAKADGVRDTTEEARKAGGDKVIGQTKAVVTIENIDSQTSIVSYRTQNGVRAAHLVQDKRLLEGLRPGDRVEITQTRERAVEIRKK